MLCVYFWTPTLHFVKWLGSVLKDFSHASPFDRVAHGASRRSASVSV